MSYQDVDCLEDVFPQDLSGWRVQKLYLVEYLLIASSDGCKVAQLNVEDARFELEGQGFWTRGAGFLNSSWLARRSIIIEGMGRREENHRLEGAIWKKREGCDTYLLILYKYELCAGFLKNLFRAGFLKISSVSLPASNQGLEDSSVVSRWTLRSHTVYTRKQNKRNARKRKRTPKKSIIVSQERDKTYIKKTKTTDFRRKCI